jgi:hypothetical protein
MIFVTADFISILLFPFHELMPNHPGLRYRATFEIRPIDEESLLRQANSIPAGTKSNMPGVSHQIW